MDQDRLAKHAWAEARLLRTASRGGAIEKEEDIPVRKSTRREVRTLRCGEVDHLISWWLMRRSGGLNSSERRFYLSGLLHLGMHLFPLSRLSRRGRPCNCWQVLRAIDAYGEQHASDTLHRRNRVDTLEKTEITPRQLEQMAKVIKRRLQHVRAMNS